MDEAEDRAERELRRSRKVCNRALRVPEPQLLAEIEQGLAQPPGDLAALMAFGARCAELLQLPGGPGSPRGCALLGSGLRRLVATQARAVAGAHLAALLVRQGRALAGAPELCELALSTVRDLAVTDRDATAAALARYNAAEGLVELLACDAAWLPLVMQCYLAGLPLPTVVGQQLLAMADTDGGRFARIIMECFHAQNQVYQAALVARRLLAGPAQRQAIGVLWEALESGPAGCHRELVGGAAAPLLQRLVAGLPADDPLRPAAAALARRAAETTELRICNYFT